MPKNTSGSTDQAEGKNPSLNKGIELMLPRARRENKSNIDFDMTLPFFIKWRCRLRIKFDITENHGN
jgi:hypothetical protein